MKVNTNGSGSKTKFRGVLTVTNTGKRAASDVRVGAYLSSDKVFSPADDRLITTINLSDLGVPTLSKKNGTTGALSVRFTAKTGVVGATGGKYLLVVADPDNLIKEGDKTNNTAVFGPLP